MTSTWAEVAKTALEYRTEKGFIPATWENAACRICAISSEIYEVEVALQHSQKWGQARETDVRLELADVCLYIVTLQSDLGFEPGTPRLDYHTVGDRYASPSRLTQHLRREWNQVFRYWRKREEKDLAIALEILLTATNKLHDVLFPPGQSLMLVCFDKLVSMRFRPALHGGKDPRT